jgi:hypothetical protein
MTGGIYAIQADGQLTKQAAGSLTNSHRQGSFLSPASCMHSAPPRRQS